MTTLRYYATCALGLESVLQQELGDLGASSVQVRRGGVEFLGDRALGYAACLWLRSAVRLQEQLAAGQVRDRDQLYRLTQQIDWSRSIDARKTLAVDASARDAFTTDTRFPALVVKDAVCDQLRSRLGARPDVDRENPDLRIKLVLQGDRAILYRDLAGVPLHKRGYRTALHKSPLNEALAAGLLLATDWDRRSPLCDPMCGSATFLTEAALLATDRAPGLARGFAFERFADADLQTWGTIYDDAERRAQTGADRCPPLLGNDRHPGALALANEAITALGLRAKVRLQRGPARDYRPPVAPDTVVVNPPYGERLHDDPAALADDWHQLGTFLHERCPGAVAWVLSGDPALTRHLRLRADRRTPVRNGPIECRWIRYALAPAGDQRERT